MAIRRLAYAELRVDDAGASLAFQRDAMGLRELAREGERVFFGCGADGSCDLVTTPGGTGVASFAFSVDSEDDLARYAARFADAGVASERRADPAPGFGSALRFQLPSGHTMELVTAPEANARLAPSVGVAPGEQRLDHLEQQVARLEQRLDHLERQQG